MSYLASFGSGMLEQSLENKRLEAERRFKLIEDLSPLVLKEIGDKKTLLKAEEKTKSSLAKFYKPNEINLLLNANENLLYSADPLGDAQKLITSMGGTNKFIASAESFEAPELATSTEQELDNYKQFYTQNISEQLGTGTAMLDFVLGNKSNTMEDQQTAPAEAPIETTEQPMVDTQEVSTGPVFRDIAFGSTEAFVNSDAGKIALADKSQDKRADNMTTYQWLQTDVDINTGETQSQFTGSDFNPIPRQDYYTIEYNKQVGGSPQGNDIAQNQTRIELEGGTQELTTAEREYIQNIISQGNAEEAQGAIEFLTSRGIPFAEEFPQLNVIASS